MACLAISSVSSFKAKEEMELDIKFFKNCANVGGALFVNGSADNSTCFGDQHSSECFFQNPEGLQFVFKNNYAEESGSNLFGGLLDRCTEPSGIARFQEISNIRNLSTVSSDPVSVCLCESYISNCSLQSHSITVKQGDPFTMAIYSRSGATKCKRSYSK